MNVRDFLAQIGVDMSTMNVKQLREFLSHLPDDMPVILRPADLRAAHSPLRVCYADIGYVADNAWSGKVALLALTPALKELGYVEADVNASAVPCCVLCPMVGEEVEL